MSLGYGTSVWCGDKLRTGRLVSGSRAVAQSLYRRFTTPRGTLRGSDTAATFGYDLAGLVGSVGTDAAVAAIPAIVRAEALKDERVARCTVASSSSQDSAGLVAITLTLDVALANSSEVFSLSLSVTDAGVALQGSWPE